MSFVLDSPSRAVRFVDEPVRGNVIRAPEDYQRNLLTLLEKLTAGYDEDGVPVLKAEAEREVTAIGRELYHELFPRELRRIYDEIRDDVETLLILSDEPWIPWEIIRPDRRDDDDFLCLRHQMSRWLTGTVHLADERVVRRIACIDAGDASDLKGDGEEKKLLEKLKSKIPGLDLLEKSGATLAQVGELLETESFDLLHYAGHGRFNDKRASGSKIDLSDRALRPRHLTLEAERKLAGERPLVFFNSCQVGRVGVALTELSGWAPHWVRKCECSAFLAPIWAVGDEPAYRFAEVFYDSLLAGATLGKAVQHARTILRAERPGEISWLAYSLYGPPNGRVSFGEPRTTVSKPVSKTPVEPALPEAREPAPHLVEARRLRAQAAADQTAPQGSRGARAIPQLVKTALGSIAAAGVVLLLVFPPPWGASQERLETASPPQTLFDDESPGSIQEDPPPSTAGPGSSGTGEVQADDPGLPEERTSVQDRESRSAPQKHATTADLVTKQETVVSAPPPPPSTVPLRPITEGKAVVVALRQDSTPADDSITAAIRSVLMAEMPGFSIETPPIDLVATEIFGTGAFPDSATPARTPWGAEFILVTYSSVKQLSSGSTPSFMISMEAKLIRTADQEVVAFTPIRSHTGMGGNEQAALFQAAERCLGPLMKLFHQGV